MIEDTHARVLRRAASPDHGRWLAHVASTRGCIRPVRLTGALHTVEQATGRIIATRHTTTDLPDGVIYVPCGDRRASVCPACAETYRADTYQLIRAGLVGGKGVPDTVATHPVVFATLTAPSFGPVHTRSGEPARRGRCGRVGCAATSPAAHTADQLVCTKRHAEDDPRLGRPICLDCYDHAAPRRLERLGRGTLAPHHHHARPGRCGRSSAPTTSGCGSPTARSPNTNAAASCTSTP